MAASLPFAEKSVATVREEVPAWPATWEGAPIWQLPLTEKEQLFNNSFPGRVAKFSDGRREFILRWVTKGTRQLHSSVDCFRGLGYSVTPQPAMLDQHGGRWSCFAATRAEHHLIVRQRITDAHGHEWTDVSAWFWSVILRQTEGPWLAVTIVEKQT
jgi:hypothetical protein